MIVVHHLENSRSQRILWLLEELGEPYEIKLYKRDPRTMRAPAELRAVHPLGKSPVVTDGDRTVAESGAIVEYLVETYGNGRFEPPAGSPDRLRYRYYLHFAEGSMMPPLLMKLVFSRLPSSAPALVRPVARAITDKALKTFVQPQLDQILKFLEGELANRDWFAGEDMTAADIQMSFPLEGAAARGGLDGRYPRLKDFLARIHARPAYRRALERGGPYALLS
ncbi:MAG: glutathione S-transferase [Hyphomicrobiales bacterium]|nr:glutathione S-transferase [Rhodoblastus sp.]MCB9998347.1 glutathione S-transferase [Methylobacteriaceae bacterium]MCC2099728.1 glutathione S-transferase [Hyphomicrobiales bacterium]HRY02169.1 glutathione S-transferase [Beijerinckiaceae bacterium]MCB1522948.1 glutathione S-transferase [Rhodoblastus sp.]